MAHRPNPDGWKGGKEDFTYLRTFDGRLVHSDEDKGDPDNLEACYDERFTNAVDLNDIFGG